MVEGPLNHMDRGAILNVFSNHALATKPANLPYVAVKASIDGMTGRWPSTSGQQSASTRSTPRGPPRGHLESGERFPARRDTFSYGTLSQE